MKKITSICLALVLVFSICSVFAAAKGSVNLAQGEGVTLTGAPTYNDGNSNYSGDLLDNQVGTDQYNSLWAGFYNNKTSTHNNYDGKNGIVVMDLGKVYANIDTVEAHIWDSKGTSGIASPAHIYISASVDGETYTDLGELTFSAEAIDWATLTLSSPVNARYIKYNFDKGSNGGVFMFVSELAVWGDGSVANTAPVLTWKDNWVNDPADVKPEDGQNLVFDNAYDYTFNIDADKTIAGEDNIIVDNVDDYNACNPNWAISVLLKPTATAGTYEVAAPAVVTPGTAANGLAAGINFDNGNIVLVAHSAYSYEHEKGTNWTSKLCAIALKVGDKVVLSEDKSTLYVPVPAGGVQTVKEEITVDGNHNDTGWAKDGWVEVSGDNGFWQNPLPWQVENGVYPDLAYKYQVRADETKLYVAVEVNCALVEGGNGNGTNVRFWLNTNDEATVYTHFYDVFKKDGVVSYNAKYNTSTTANSGANTENSTIVPAITSENGKTYVEFSVDLAEFNGEEGFNYFICVSNKANADTNNVCLYYPAMPIGPVTDTHDGPNHIPYQNLPYVTWHRATQATVVVEDILLGEVVVDNGSDEEVKEEADTSMMGTAPAAPKFSATLNGPEAWVAGEKVKIDVVIEVLEDELALNQILFNLFFDAADVEITLPTDDFSALVTAAPADSWKGENAMFALSTVDGYGLISGGVGSENEADSLKKGDKVVVSFEFTAKADAKGLINFQLSNDELAGYTYADPATAIAGAGSNLAIAEKTDDLGDAGIYAIAALAIVALIGTAVVIKKRA